MTRPRGNGNHPQQMQQPFVTQINIFEETQILDNDTYRELAKRRQSRRNIVTKKGKDKKECNNGGSAHKPQFYWNYSAAAAPGARPTPSRVAMASPLSKPFLTFPSLSHFPVFLSTFPFPSYVNMACVGLCKPFFYHAFHNFSSSHCPSFMAMASLLLSI